MNNKLFLLGAFALLLSSCASQPTDFQRVEAGEPIMPVRMLTQADTLYLTDYLPSVNLSEIGRLEVNEATYQLSPIDDASIVICGADWHVGVLSASDAQGTTIQIPVLPKIAPTQGLTSVGGCDKCVRLAFEGQAPQAPVFAVFVQNRYIPNCIEAAEDGTYVLHLDNVAKLHGTNGRTFLRVFAAADGVLYNDLLIPLQDGKPVREVAGLTRHDANNQVLYSLMIDRFENGNTANDWKINSPEVLDRVDYQGGDFAGITKRIREGWFDTLGINTIWVSPITQNPYDAWGQYNDPKTKFSGYHGYWPIFNTKVEARFGTDDELRELLATAHAHQINVVLDYVANHMHIQSPTLQAHPDWVTDSILPDGRRNFELWDEARLTTWFDVHIPSLDLEREDVCDAMTDTALFWVTSFDFDGYRHDACKHIPLNYWRMFTHKMKSRFPDRSLWMIGETYGDAELIGSYVKTGMLNAQFDFNIYHTAIDVLGKEGESMTRMAKVVDESLAAYGYHHTMGNISGNHDKCRFISLAGGAVSWDENDKDAGWHRQIGVTADGDPVREDIAFRKALLLEVINFGIPGVPCVYQGDEYGQCGANDPDNRRMMRFDGLNEKETWFRTEMEKLIRLRRTSMPLIYGDYRLLFVDDTAYAFERTYMGERVVFAINNSAATRSIPVGDDMVEVAPYSFVIR